MIDSDSHNPAAKSYNSRKLTKLRKRRKIRKFKIFLARLRVLTRLASYVLIVWGFLKITTLPLWYLNENIFMSYPNKYLEIDGYNIVSSKQILKKLREIDLPDDPLYLIDTKIIEKKLEELTPVKGVLIRRYWLPARLKIVIDERTPVLSITPGQTVNPVAVFTKDSNSVKILGRKYLPLPENIQTYKIITYDDYKQWKPFLVPYIEQLVLYLENATDDRLVYLDIRNPDDVYVQMENLKLRIGTLKGKEIFKRIEKVSSVVPEAVKIKESINYIDLRWDNVSIKLKKNKLTKPGRI